MIHSRIDRNPAVMVVDIFRFDANCLIVEHWDVTQPVIAANKTASGHDMGGCLSCGGAGGSCDFSTQTKISAGLGILTRGYNGFEISDIQILVGNMYYQHDPLVADGFGALADVLKALSASHPTRQILSPIRAFAGNDLVFVHSHYAVNAQFVFDPTGPGMAIVDIFRFNLNCQIVEHWNVVQAVVVPEETVSGNDMFSCITCVQ